MAKERKYVDFIIEVRGLDPEDDKFEVAVTPSKELGEPAPVSVQYGYDELEEALQYLDEKRIDAEDLIRLGSEREIKAHNLVRQEPKDYVVRDGDILHIKFSV